MKEVCIVIFCILIYVKYAIYPYSIRNVGGFPVERFPVVERFPLERHSFVLQKNIHLILITCSIRSIQFCIVLIYDEIFQYWNYIIQDEINVSEGGMDRGDNGRIIVKSPIIYTLKKSID